MANPAINAALIAVAAQQQALTEQHILTPLKKAGATSARTAIAARLFGQGRGQAARRARSSAATSAPPATAATGSTKRRSSAVKAAGLRIALIVIAFLLSVTVSLVALLAR